MLQVVSAATQRVTIGTEYLITPNSLTINVGDSIIFARTGLLGADLPVSLNSEDGLGQCRTSKNNLFPNTLLDVGNTFSLTFRQPGTYLFYISNNIANYCQTVGAEGAITVVTAQPTSQQQTTTKSSSTISNNNKTITSITLTTDGPGQGAPETATTSVTTYISVPKVPTVNLSGGRKVVGDFGIGLVGGVVFALVVAML
ncbi:hypothetical protein HDU76_007940 [Blyttiomyces sp. JEL0837]|nr:hypothetical protein HDU76_007940 [Blyttiomyces sp. JEL0837]